MTLKEKIKEANNITWFDKENIIELIADNFAIEFAKWYVNTEEFNERAEIFLKDFKEQRDL